jgi:hypothetical protein
MARELLWRYGKEFPETLERPSSRTMTSQVGDVPPMGFDGS